MRARKAQASSSQSSPAISAVDRGHWHLQASRQGSRRGLQLRGPMPSGSMLTGGTSSVSAKLRVPQTLRPPSESESPFVSSHLVTARNYSYSYSFAPSAASIPPPPPDCNCIVLLHHSFWRQHALFYLSHCAASRHQQQIYRQGRCSRHLRLVERAPGPSSESIARASVVAGPS